MKVVEKTVTFAEITPDEGMMLYNGDTVAGVAYAPVDQADKWREVSEAEATEIKAAQEAARLAEDEALKAEEAAGEAGSVEAVPAE